MVSYTSWSFLALNAPLIFLIAVSGGTFLSPFVYGVTEVLMRINSWLLVISGLLINTGTIFQIYGNIVKKNNVLQFNYLTCLVCGCFLLFMGQLFTYVHKMVLDTDFLISLLGSGLSFTFTLTLLIIHKVNDIKKRVSRLPRKIVYYEGTSGIGKTTKGINHSYDFTTYIEKNPLFKLKQSLPYVQTMYMMQLYSDIILDLMDFAQNESIITSLNDRHIFSQLVYDILFYYKGENTKPQDFCERVNCAIFNNKNYVQLLRQTMQRVITVVKTIAPNTRIHIDWFVSSDPLFTKHKIINRGGFEIHQNNWNLLWYVENQNFLFKKLWEISEIGDMHVVKLIK